LKIINLSAIPIRVSSGNVYHLYQSIAAKDLDQLVIQNKPAAQCRNLKRSGENQWRLQQAEIE